MFRGFYATECGKSVVVCRGEEILAGSCRASRDEDRLPSYSCIAGTGTPLWSADITARVSREKRMLEMARHD